MFSNNLKNNELEFTPTFGTQLLEETRYAIFSINLLEDVIQDIIYYYSVSELQPIKKIYENVNDFQQTYKLIREVK